MKDQFKDSACYAARCACCLGKGCPPHVISILVRRDIQSIYNGEQGHQVHPRALAACY